MTSEPRAPRKGAPPTVSVVGDSTRPARRKRTLGDVIFGRRLASAEEEEQRIGPLAGVPVLGLDALSSAAYGPEAALTLLLPLGALGLTYVVPITGDHRRHPPRRLLLLPADDRRVSRRRRLLHRRQGEPRPRARRSLAGAALALDYVLNVAVGISAGVGALVSAVPALLPHTLALCLAILALLTLVNLRGTRESGITFMLPTYLFVGTLAVVLVVGTVKTALAAGTPSP